MLPFSEEAFQMIGRNMDNLQSDVNDNTLDTNQESGNRLSVTRNEMETAIDLLANERHMAIVPEQVFVPQDERDCYNHRHATDSAIFNRDREEEVLNPIAAGEAHGTATGSSGDLNVITSGEANQAAAGSSGAPNAFTAGKANETAASSFGAPNVIAADEAHKTTASSWGAPDFRRLVNNPSTELVEALFEKMCAIVEKHLTKILLVSCFLLVVAIAVLVAVNARNKQQLVEAQAELMQIQQLLDDASRCAHLPSLPEVGKHFDHWARERVLGAFLKAAPETNEKQNL